MKKIVIDSETLAKLQQVREELELFDEHGRRLGVVQPDPLRNHSLYEEVDCPIATEELQRRAQQLGGRSLAEIMRDLEKQQS